MSLRLRPMWSEIVAALRAQGVAIPDAPLPDAAGVLDDAPPSPWFVRALVGLGAWVAALLVFGAAAMAVGAKDGMIVVGLVGIGAGIFLLRLSGGGAFMRQLGLSASLAGQLALGVGLRSAIDSDSAFLAVALAVEIALVVVAPFPVHRFFSTVLAAVAGCAWLLSTRWPLALDICVLLLAAGAAFVWLDQPHRLRRRGQRGKRPIDPWLPVGYGLVIALFATLLAGLGSSSADRHGLSFGLHLGRLASAGLGLGTVALALGMAAQAGAPRPSPVHAAALASLALLGFVTPSVPGVAAAAGVLLLAIHRRNPILLGLAVVFLIAFLALLYYSLTATLLSKSLHLMVAGLLLLAGAWWLRRGEAR